MSERLKCQKDTKIIYNYLNGKSRDENKEELNYPSEWPENKGDGQLYGIKASTLFSLALAIGYKNDKKIELKSYSDLSNPVNFEEYLFPLINAVAIYEEGLDVLKKETSNIYKNAEEYANGGINILNEIYQKDMDGIITRFHLEIDDMIKENKIFERIDEI